MELWYDIYALTEQRNLATIEKFLCQFADREKIEPRERDVITIIPNVPLAEKHNLFKKTVPGVKHRNPIFSRPESSCFHIPNHIQSPITSLSEAIRVGLSGPDISFSLYLRKYLRSDVKCLILSFTLDNKLIIGISLAEKNKHSKHNRRDKYNWSLVQRIYQELEDTLPLKALSIQFESAPADSEAEFMEAKQAWDEKVTSTGIDKEYKLDIKNKISEGTYLNGYSWHGYYYFVFRHRIHRHYRESTGKMIFSANNSDYFTLGDAQGRFINIIRSHGDRPSIKVSDLSAYDAVKLSYLGNLLYRAIKPRNENFLPTSIYKVAIPASAKTEPIWIGHRDGVSNFTLYEGIRASELEIHESYVLDDIAHIKRLAEEGFFLFKDGFLSKGNNKAYLNWLVIHQKADLFKALLRDEDLNIDFYGKTDLPNYLE